ncbi:MAG: hypothetical protein H0V11_04515 [Actinobacteria bacterium]|nr:hypothetical protein [Actinomycetota bacterium]
MTDEELAERGEIDVDWLREFKKGYASRRSPTVRVTERLLNAVGLTLVAAKL